MTKSLIIVESPNKIKTLKKFLGKDYEIKSSLGHIRNLPRKKLGVDIKDGFAPEYITEQGKDKTIRELKKATKSCERVYLAPDPDREGEAISWHLAKVLDISEESDCRITFNAITRNEVLKSLESPRKIDMHLVNAQQSRRILDRLVGYKLSPVLWDKIHKGLSAGRVQSVAMLLICSREEDICRFLSKEYWNIFLNIPAGEKGGEGCRAKLVRFGSRKAVVENEAEARTVVDAISTKSYKVAMIEQRLVKKSPPSPFITSTLQQVAAKSLGFSVRKTMMLAQQLYEGIEVGDEGSIGLITYMRTDSTRTAPEALAEVAGYIGNYYGDRYSLKQPREFIKKKNVQDAHECIRPTALVYTPDRLAQQLNKDQLKLYTFIFNRFVASQMAPAEITNCTVEIANGNYIFALKGSRIDFDGYMKLYNVQETDDEEDGRIPDLKEGQEVHPDKVETKQNFTQPPPRYTEGTLVKELEKNGVGRPSTYAVIISTILKREYVRLIKKQFLPTELGLMVNKLLHDSFSDIINVEFTAHLEEALDDIAGGRSDWQDILKKFYDSFENTLSTAAIKKISVVTDILCRECGKQMVLKFANKNRFFACTGFPVCRSIVNISEEASFNKELIESSYEIVKVADRLEEIENRREAKVTEPELTEIVCEKCGKPMVIREGVNGKFLGCQGFPACRNTRPLEEETVEPAAEGEKPCEKCGKLMVVKYSRSGKFMACSGYPECKQTRSLPLNAKCSREGCAGEIVIRRGKKGRPFYGCSKYPDCDFTSWKRPE